MTIIYIYIILLLIFLVVFNNIFQTKILNYDSRFWGIVEIIWLLTSFTGVSFGLYELNRINSQFEFKEKEKDILIEFQSVRNSVYGQTFVLLIDSSMQPNRRESIRWFHVVQNLLEDGYQSPKWRSFLYYTRAFVFEEIGYLNVTQDNALIFKWPENINMQTSEIEFKDEIRVITTKLIHLEQTIDNIEKLRPDDKPVIGLKYLFFLLFTLVLSLKLLNVYTNYLKSKTTKSMI